MDIVHSPWTLLKVHSMDACNSVMHLGFILVVLELILSSLSALLHQLFIFSHTSFSFCLISIFFLVLIYIMWCHVCINSSFLPAITVLCFWVLHTTCYDKRVWVLWTQQEILCTGNHQSFCSHMSVQIRQHLIKRGCVLRRSPRLGFPEDAHEKPLTTSALTILRKLDKNSG